MKTTLGDIVGLDQIETPEEHMEVLMDTFRAAWEEKYMKGQREHGGRLWRKRTTDFLVDEVLDFVSYVGVLAPQLNRVEEILEKGQDGSANQAMDAIRRALNILRVGNEEGTPEKEN